MNLILKIAAGVVLAVIVLTVGCAALVSSSMDTGDKKAQTVSETRATSETSSQENARQTANDYLAYQSFSRKGLIHQLEYEGYSTSDATYAVRALSPDWYEQAAKTAKDYLDSQSFSRKGLVHQLEFDGFTHQQAAWGVGVAY